MVIRADGPFLVHAHVECRNRGRPWWRYARPVLSSNALLISILTGSIDDIDADVVPLLGIPHDCSDEIRDEFAGATRDRWPIDRLRPTEGTVFEQATWLQRRDFDRMLRMYERLSFDPAPATCCAAVSMMAALERDYEVRLILWLERLVPTRGTVAIPRASRVPL